MSKPFALAAFALIAASSCATAATPPSNPLAADVLTVVLPGARAEDPAATFARNNGWKPAQSATDSEVDVEVTGGPASRSKSPQHSRP